MNSPIPFPCKRQVGASPDLITALIEQMTDFNRRLAEIEKKVHAGELARFIDGRIERKSDEFNTLKRDATRALGALMNECEHLRGPVNAAIAKKD